MGFWICFNCGSHNVYEKMYVRLNRLACIIDDVEDLMEIALKARKNKDIACLKDINNEFYRRISNKEMSGKVPTKTARKGFNQTETWLNELGRKN